MARTSDDRRPDTWDDCEAAVSAALARMRELAGGPAAVGPDAAALGLVDVVRGSAGVWQAFWLHADLTAASEVCAVVPDLRPLIDVAEGTTLDQLAEVGQLVARGDLHVRLVLPPAAAEVALTRAVGNQFVDAGMDVRVGDTARWFFVARGRVVATPLQWERTDEVDVAVLRTRSLVAAMEELFDLRWRESVPWGAAERSFDAVLRLLARGLDDDGVAGELGLSVRTVRRRVADAMDEYAASSRFELAHRWATRTSMSETR